MAKSKKKKTPEERAGIEKRKAEAKQRRKQLRKSGICVQCETHPHVNGFRCQVCLDRRAAARQRKREREAARSQAETERRLKRYLSEQIVWKSFNALNSVTGVDDDDCEPELRNAVLSAFWGTLPQGAEEVFKLGWADKFPPEVIVTRDQGDAAYTAGLRVYEEYRDSPPPERGERLEPDVIHFVIGAPWTHAACGIVGYPWVQGVSMSSEPDNVKGCLVCEVEAMAFKAENEKTLVAIFLGCGCEVTSYSASEGRGIVMAPHRCHDHDGYFLGEGPPSAEYMVVYVSADEARDLCQDVLDTLSESSAVGDELP